MLRRFEIYSIAPDAPATAIEALVRATRDCARWIPEVLHSAIGWNRAPGLLHFIWEHGFASAAVYRRYMEHPFHAAVLDRYLMPDSPERVTCANGIGAGLLGYRCDTPDYTFSGGARRVVALRLAQGTEHAFAMLAAAQPAQSEMILSRFHDNYLGSRWYDGESCVGPKPAFGHVWEQGFTSIESALRYGAPWREAAGSMVENMVEVVYKLEHGYGGISVSNAPSGLRITNV